MIKKITTSLLLLASMTMFAPAKAENVVAGVAGSVSGAVVGAVASTARGATSKAIEYGNETSAFMGDGFLGRSLGFHLGAVVGVATGAVTGLAKGFLNGIHEGYSRPFSEASISMDGEYIDYEPYHML